MKLTLDRDDLKETRKEVACSLTKFKHFNAQAQRAILLVGKATFQEYDRSSYNVIYPPKQEQSRSKAMLGQVSHTQRGFEYIKFTDLNKQECSVQQSSLAVYQQPGTSAIWLGTNERMHLSFEQVKELIATLQKWVDDGTFQQEQGNDNQNP